MFTYRLTTATVLTVLLCTSTSFAQHEMRWGLGVGIPGNRADLAAAVSEITTPVGFYVPINTGQLRLEPELGLLFLTLDEADFAKQKFKAVQIGGGIFALRRLDEAAQAYFGGRLGLVIVSQSVEDEFEEASSTDVGVTVGPAVGAEYFFGRGFSLGGEAQLMYFSLRLDQTNTNISMLSTRPLFFVRWYFR